MHSLWRYVCGLEGSTLRTLGRGKPFVVLLATARAVNVVPESSGKERSIPRSALQGALGDLRDRGLLTLNDIRSQWCDFSPAYVAAILAELPDVTHRLRPITLLYTP